MAIPPQAMPEQPAAVRARNMKEVALGYTPQQARLEASRCLQCPTRPCVQGCPVSIDIPGFLGLAAQGDFPGALRVIRKSSLLPAVCGRVCPQEKQCQKNCTMGKVLKTVDGAVAIGRVERFCADLAREQGDSSQEETPCAPPTGKRVAVIGSGPASITVAADCARAGHKVTVYEAFHQLGGVLVYGIPEFRLPKTLVQEEIDKLSAMGVEFLTNMVIGKVLTVDELLEEEGFEAVYLASGAGLPSFMNIPGESLNGVYSANEYLTRVNLMKAYLPGSHTPIAKSRKVAVVGGGNVAMDAARCAKRLGAEEVSIVYRRSMEELPARAEEVEHAQEEGILFRLLTNPVEILGDEKGYVSGMKCIRMELGEPDASGRRRPVPVEGSEYVLEADTVIMSIGTAPNPLIRSTTPGLETNKHGCIVTDGPDGLTSRPGVYAGGDAVTGAATVILAMGAGKQAAAAIDKYIQGK